MSVFPQKIDKNFKVYFVNDVNFIVKDHRDDVDMYNYNFKHIGIGYCPRKAIEPLKIINNQVTDSVIIQNNNGLSLCCVHNLKSYNFGTDEELYHQSLFTYQYISYKKWQRVYKIPKDIHIMYHHTKIIKASDLERYMLIRFCGCTDIANSIGWFMLEFIRLNLTQYPKSEEKVY